jgi:GT2 family glycosyltransferase
MEETQPTPKVTVLIVSYNCVEPLRRCLEALERSTARESMEILVVDNGSRDESGQVDREYPAVTVLRIPRNFGLTKARNIGVRTAKGDYILFLDPEVEVEAETIPELVGRMESDSTAGAVCPLLVDPEGNPESQTGKLPSPEDLYRWWSQGEAYRKALPGTSVITDEYPNPEGTIVECADPRAVLVRRLFVKGMNYFDERYGEFGSNLELFLQVRRAAKKIVLLPEVRAVWRPAGELRKASDAAAAADLDADYVSGIIAFASKHYGWAAGLKLRALSILRALFSFRFGVLSRLLSGQKIDGSQAGI